MVSRENKIKMACGYGVTERRAAAPLKKIGMLRRGEEEVQGLFVVFLTLWVIVLVQSLITSDWQPIQML